jgi:hypothetical protein
MSMTIGALLAGFHEISVPLLLRAFCRALKQPEFEPNCDALLKIAVGLIAVRLLFRVILQFFLLWLAGPLGLLSTVLGFAWVGLYVVVLAQLWGAMGKR